MNEWELTTEEIEQARDYGEYEYEDDTLEVGQFIEEEVLAGNRAVATAAQKRLVEWSEGECKHDSKRIRRCCDLCWRDVRAALGVK